MNDDHPLERFVEAQNPVFERVCAELAAGAKASHWMWFIFPQHAALGCSAMARHFGIASRAEAEAYWRHPLLGARLKTCTGLMLAVQRKSALQILGSPDDLKFRSCMTLFAHVAPDEPMFRQALDQYFGGVDDGATPALLDGPAVP
jgi:uncharacterized protein (DUF1810 family)